VSRSGYSDDCEGSDLAMWRGTIASATRGKRGQRFFRDLVAALDAMPVKRLIKNDIETVEGDVCALGALRRKRGVELEPDDVCYPEILGDKFDIASQLAQETMFVNDEAGRRVETDEERWIRVRAWAAKQVRAGLIS
jgi:hypothetical protein